MATIRVNDAEILEIVDTKVTSFTAFIIAASIIVDTKLATPGIITDTTQLKEIERWLAAHLFIVMERQTKKEEVGETSIEYFMMSLGKGLDSTLHGQQVKILDTSGTLASLGKRKANIITIEAISYAQ